MGNADVCGESDPFFKSIWYRGNLLRKDTCWHEAVVTCVLTILYDSSHFFQLMLPIWAIRYVNFFLFWQPFLFKIHGLISHRPNLLSQQNYVKTWPQIISLKPKPFSVNHLTNATLDILCLFCMFGQLFSILTGMTKERTCFYHHMSCVFMEQDSYAKQLKGLQGRHWNLHLRFENLMIWFFFSFSVLRWGSCCTSVTFEELAQQILPV